MYSNGLHHAVSLGNFEVETISAGQRQHVHRNCDSDDENTMRRRRLQQIESNPCSSIYSKGDIQEQYCLTDRQLQTVERSRRARFLGCLSKRGTSQSILGVCVGKRAPSDENLATYTPFYRFPRYPHQLSPGDTIGVNSSFRRQPASILSSSRVQDDHVRSASSTSWQDMPNAATSFHNDEIYNNDSSTKHVSFARSHTLTCFDDVNMEYYPPYRYDESRSQERLIGGKTVSRAAYVSPTSMTLMPTPTPYYDHSCGHAHFQHAHLHSCVPAPCCNSTETQTKCNIGVLPCQMKTSRAVTPEIVVIENKKRNTMKTQATQTELRSTGLPNVLNLSPRTTHKVKVVSQSAQTNGMESRKQTKSLSEMPNDQYFKVKLSRQPVNTNDAIKPMEDYYRPAPPIPGFQLERNEFVEQESELPYKEADLNLLKSGLKFSGIDLLPPPQQYLQLEEQHLLEEQNMHFRPRRLSMISIENCENENYFRRDDLRRQSMPVFLKKEEYSRKSSLTPKSNNPAVLREEKEIFIDFKPNLLLTKPPKLDRLKNYYEKTAKFTANTYENFGLAYKDCPCTVASVTNSTITSEDENHDPFYENVSVEPCYVNKNMKQREQIDRCLKQDVEKKPKSEAASASVPQSPTRINVSTYPSSDSLANDTREYSDGIWNESQVTVLTVENRDINDEENFRSNLHLITPSTKRKKLLLQHQQRSSVDTEGLDLEDATEHLLSQNRDIESSYLQVPTNSNTPTIAVTEVIESTQLTQAVSPKISTKIFNELQKADSSLPHIVERKSSYSYPSEKERLRMNADVSECSTNTDDYGTCTDNSKRTPGTKTSTTTTSSSSTTQVPASTQSSQLDKTYENSSFESASSLYSVREEISIDEALQKDPSLLVLMPEKTCIDMFKRSPTHSLSSVSSGSYNIARLMGVSPLRTQAHINEKQQRISPTSDNIKGNTTKVIDDKPESATDDDDEQSLHPCSSSGYYESPQKDDKNLTRIKLHNRTEEERKRRKTIIKQNIEKENMRALTSPMKTSQYTSSKNTSSQRLSSPPTLEISSPARMKRSRPKLRRHLRKQQKDGIVSKIKSEEGVEPEISELTNETREKLLDLIINDKNVNEKTRSPILTDAKKLKAQSIESLCSVSPGSDSVFYSETDGGNVESQSQCFNCGKDIEGSTSMISAIKNDSIESLDNMERDIEQDIVKPPSDFADSPITIKTIQRLYKKINKKYRSEDRYHERGRHFKNRQENIRAKSEERNKENQWRSAKSLRSSGSSPSVLPDVSFEQNQQIVYRAHYNQGRYIHLSDADVWAQLNVERQDQKRTRSPSTDSEKSFCIKYQVILHRLIQRRCTLEMYHRQKKNTFNVDKTVTVKRVSGEFGFRIHGSKPVVVAAIEANTPAESSGLEVGDILISVNGIKVLDKHHTEVVKIAQDGCDSLELKVARTMGVLMNEQIEETSHLVFSGYLWRQSPTAKKWVRRWFSLRKNNCLYYYKSEQDNHQPLGVLLLNHPLIEEVTSEIGKPFAFKIKTDMKKVIQMAADTEEMKNQWIVSIKQSTLEENTWLDVCANNLYHSPASIQKSDCQGYLFKLGPRWSGWSQRYCVLKEACMFFYQEERSHSAFGMICLHGYKVASISANSAGKKNAFELIPPDPKLRHYYFSTESDSDKKRWVSALEYSIDRWISSG